MLAEIEKPKEEPEYILITVEKDGRAKADLYNNLKDIAEKILEQIEETVSADLLLDLPGAEVTSKATLITTDNTGLYYIVEEEHNRWMKRRIIPTSKAILYTANEEVLSNISDSKLYVRGKAILVRNTIFYQISINRTQIKDIETELKLALSENESP
jgi:hypothetical protein